MDVQQTVNVPSPAGGEEPPDATECVQRRGFGLGHRCACLRAVLWVIRVYLSRSQRTGPEDNSHKP